MNLLLLTPASFALLLAQASPASDLSVVLHGVDASRPGRIQCALFAGAEGFPMQPETAVASTTAEGHGAERRCTFRGLAPGEYAVSVVHDENGDGKLNTNLFGAPTEGWATSGNVTHALRAPDFAESKFQVGPAPARVDLELHY